MIMLVSRRNFTVSGLGAVGLAALGRSALAAAAPKSPVTINIIDVAGNLALTRPAFDAYKAAKPNFVSDMTFTQAPAPELPAKIKAQQNAGRLEIDLVLTGTDALAAGIEQGLWTQLLPAYANDLPALDSIYLPAAAKMQTLAKGQGVVVTYYPSGPLFEYMPDNVKTPPKTAAELMAWAKANDGRFMYARPANSGPGRTLLMGLPYILGDADPTNPKTGWDKTWAYLQELGKSIEYYPSGTGATMKELGDGSRDMIASTTGWDINPRVLGIVPMEAKVLALEGMHWVADAHYMCAPKGVSDEKLGVLLDLMSYLLEPKSQAFAYDKGYFYPGPAVKDVPLSMAPQASQDALKTFGHPEYDDMIAAHPIELPLAADAMVLAFKMWDEKVGAAKSR
jgi:putative spermidine/putrescine transport system substrate-binding protein